MTDSYKSIQEYWTPNNGRKWEKIYGLLPSHVEHLLAATLVRQDNERTDRMCWGLNTDGKFTLKSVYTLTRHNDATIQIGSWKQIWSLKVPQRIRTFVWLLHHGKILTNQVRARRGLTFDPYCKHCPGCIEHLDHIFRNCSKRQRFWGHLMNEDVLSHSQDLPFKDWLCWNLTQEWDRTMEGE